MSLLAKALLIVTMSQGTGNMSVGSESVTIAESMIECRQAMRLFLYTKSVQSNTIDILNGKDSLSFSVERGMLQSDTNYKLTCTSFEEVQ